MVTTPSVSTSSVISTIVANLAFFGIFMSIFLLFRIKLKRIYMPKSSFNFVPEDKKPEPLPSDPFRWLFLVLRKSNTFLLNQAGLDGFFFLRYIYIFGLVFLVGCLSFIILLPVNATNGYHDSHSKSLAKTDGFDQLSISNIKHKNRYYAHVFIGWIYYGLVIFVIYRELFFYNSLKSAALASPKYAEKLSSRTVLFRFVPDPLLDEKQLFKIFNGVKRIYVARTVRKLEGRIRRRSGLANRLELAENKLLRAAVKAKMKADKKHITIEPADEIDSYVPEKKRPRFRANGWFSKKVDTVKYCHEEIPKLDREVRHLQKRYREFAPKNSLIVEFENQYAAQVALQSTSHHNPLRMSQRSSGSEPSDMFWANLRVFWWEQIMRSFLAIVITVLIIIFYAIPVAFIGTITNITALTNKLPWLRWILNMPDKLLGIITGLLPSVLLVILISLVPVFFRFLAKISGAPTLQHIDQYVQRAYFGFMIVNAFLVTALSSSASSTATQVFRDPSSAMTILASNLPKSSNFYISYLTLQGLSIASGTLAQVVGLLLYYILGNCFDNTVRKKWNRFSGLGAMGWGATYPVYTNLICISLAFSMIAPLILIFAAAAFFLVYVAFAHNLSYVLVEGADLRGRNYPTALFQTFTGIYLGQICMIGIFAVGKGWGPIVLQAIAIGATVFCHVNLNKAFGPLLDVVALDCMRPLDGVSQTYSFKGVTEFKTKILDKKNLDKNNLMNEKREHEQIKNDIIDESDIPESTNVVPLLADRDFKTLETKNPIIRFLRPDVFLNYRHVKTMLPAAYNIEPDMTDNKHAYDLPAISAALPGVWIPRDPMGLSKIEIEETPKPISITDENSGFNEKGKVIFLGKAPN